MVGMKSNEVESAEKLILVDKKETLTRITLNRPKVLNAINLQMVNQMIKAMQNAQTDGTRIIIIDGAGERGLSGGGDIKEMAAENAKNAHKFISREYELDLMIATSKVPVIGIMSGITMGGGIGLSGHSHLRIVTETSRLAMPETKIGIMPDVGGNLLLSKSPGKLGEYLALTATSMDAADAIALGFADLLIPEAKIEHFIEELKATDLEETDFYQIANTYAEEPRQSALLEGQKWIDPLLERALKKLRTLTTESMSEPGAQALADAAISSVQKLVKLVEYSDQAEHATLANNLREMSPISLAVSIAQIARTRALGLGIKEVLEDDLRILTRLFERPDFVEGVRALVIDKDLNPKWTPEKIEQLDTSEVARVLDPQEI